MTAATGLALLVICAPPSSTTGKDHSPLPTRAAVRPGLVSSQTAMGEAYYVLIYGADKYKVTDSLGEGGGQTETTDSAPGGAAVDDASSFRIILPYRMPADHAYTVMFRSVGRPIEIDVTRGVGNKPETATQIIRYLDLNLPAGTSMMLKFTPQGAEDLRCDRDADGTYETVVSPTASATGRAAQDADAPRVTFGATAQGTRRLIDISAEDRETGVKVVRYSLDGKKYQPYKAPLSVDACRVKTVYAIADDQVGNRSSVFTYAIPDLAPDVSRARPSVAKLWPADHKMIAVSVLGVTDPDCDSVNINITRITQDEPADGGGDGNACPDAQGVGTSTAQLRAEHDGSSDGRVYTIYFTATDRRGQAARGSVKVAAPKGRDVTAAEGEKISDSTSCPERP